MKQSSSTSVVLHCVVVLLITVGVDSTVEQCSQTYKMSSGRTCRYCAPGTHKHADCLLEGGSALCLTCPGETWQKHCNIAASCEACYPRCRQPYTVKVKGCTLYENIVCECQEGRYWKKESSDTGVCLKHSKCPHGSGMIKLGTQNNDTYCRRCIDSHTYSDEESFAACKPCTKCLEYNTTCVVTKDAECKKPWRVTTMETSTLPIESKENPFKVAFIVAVIIAGILIVVIVVFVIGYFIYRRKSREDSYRLGKTENGIEMSTNLNQTTSDGFQIVANRYVPLTAGTIPKASRLNECTPRHNRRLAHAEIHTVRPTSNSGTHDSGRDTRHEMKLADTVSREHSDIVIRLTGFRDTDVSTTGQFDENTTNMSTDPIPSTSKGNNTQISQTGGLTLAEINVPRMSTSNSGPSDSGQDTGDVGEHADVILREDSGIAVVNKGFSPGEETKSDTDEIMLSHISNSNNAIGKDTHNDIADDETKSDTDEGCTFFTQETNNESIKKSILHDPIKSIKHDDSKTIDKDTGTFGSVGASGTIIATATDGNDERLLQEKMNKLSTREPIEQGINTPDSLTSNQMCTGEDDTIKSITRDDSKTIDKDTGTFGSVGASGTIIATVTDGNDERLLQEKMNKLSTREPIEQGINTPDSLKSNQMYTRKPDETDVKLIYNRKMSVSRNFETNGQGTNTDIFDQIPKEIGTVHVQVAGEGNDKHTEQRMKELKEGNTV